MFKNEFLFPTGSSSIISGIGFAGVQWRGKGLRRIPSESAETQLWQGQKLPWQSTKNCLGNYWIDVMFSGSFLFLLLLDYLLTFPTIFYPFCLLYPIFLLLSLKESLLEMFRSIVSVDDIQIFVYSNLSPFHSKNKHIKWNISHKINQTYSNWIFSRNCAHKELVNYGKTHLALLYLQCGTVTIRITISCGWDRLSHQEIYPPNCHDMSQKLAKRDSLQSKSRFCHYSEGKQPPRSS